MTSAPSVLRNRRTWVSSHRTKKPASTLVLASAFWSACSLALPGQTVHTVTAGGNPGVQAAIDVAQPGDIIVIVEGFWNPVFDGCTPIQVSKPLTFIGQSPSGGRVPVCTMNNCSASCSGNSIGVFNILSGVAGRVVFRRLQLVGQSWMVGPFNNTRGIFSSAPSVEVVIDDCEVLGADYAPYNILDCGADGAAGIEGSLARLVIVDSAVRGGGGGNAVYGQACGPSCVVSCSAGDGGHGISVTGEVLLVRSAVWGGNGGWAQFDNLTVPGTCVDLYGGIGGSAVVAPTVWTWSVTGAGGPGGFYLTCAGAIQQSPGGSGPPAGPPSSLDAGPPVQLAGTATFSLQALPSSPYILAMGALGWGPGISIPGLGSYVLGCCPIVFAAGVGPGPLSLTVPNDPVLLGKVFPVQAVLGTSLTNSDFVLLVP